MANDRKQASELLRNELLHDRNHRRESFGTPAPDSELLEQNIARGDSLPAKLAPQYFSELATAEFRASWPSYDLERLRDAFPDVKVIDVEHDDAGRLTDPSFTMVLRGHQSETSVPLGQKLPANTDELITLIRSHLRSALDMDTLREVDKVFGEIED